MTLTNGMKAAASAAFVAVAVGLAAGGTAYLQAQGGYSAADAAAGHVVVGWGDAGGPPPGAVVVHATSWALDAATVAWGVTPVDGGPGYSYWRCNVAAVPVDGGADPGPSILPGLEIVYDDDAVGTATSSTPRIECWRQGRSDAPFPCACSTGPLCMQQDGGAAPQGITLEPGVFVPSAACLPKACVELAGSSSWDARCPL